jgi:PAS domain S-box-containing protein
MAGDVFGAPVERGLELARSGTASRATAVVAGRQLDLRFQEANDVGTVIVAMPAEAPRIPEAPRDRRLRVLFNQVPGVAWVTDAELRITHAFGRAPALAGTPAPNWIGKRIHDFAETESRSHPIVAHHLAALSGECSSFRYEQWERTFEVRIEPLRDEGGSIAGCIGIALDVTERKLMEDRLAGSEKRLSEAQRLAHIGSWEWDVAGDTLWWSDEVYRIYGVKPGELVPTMSALLDRIHPDDAGRARDAIFAALRTASPFAFEHRLIRPDKSVRTVRIVGDIKRDERGRVARMLGSCWDVTEWWTAQHDLEQSLSLLTATLEATADGILVVDTRGKIAKYNQRFLSLWHIRPELAATGEDGALLSAVLTQLEDPDAFLHRVQELYADREAESLDIIHFEDGRVFERSSRPQRMNGDVIGRVWSFRDVTDRDRLLRRALFLADASRLLASLDVELALEAVARLAVPFLGEGCAVDVFTDVGGPRRLLSVSRDADRPIPMELPRPVLSGRPLLYSVGEVSHMSLPLVAHGQILGAISFAAAPHRPYALSDLHFADELARRAALAIENARLYRKAQEALRTREEFLAIAAHEIRGPITSIHLASQGLQKVHLSGGATSNLFAIIEREDRRLARFVDELLDVGRIRAGRLHFELARVNLDEITRDVAARLGPELAASGSTLAITSSGEATGMWDRSRLDQVVGDLLSNAIKFGLRRPIEVTVSGSETAARVIIKDHGIGIPEEELPGIFEPFKRAVSARHYGGLGLGLYIVRTIVEGLGGSVRAESRPGEGTTFTVELPRGRDP